jgi:hypothetical protein
MKQVIYMAIKGICHILVNDVSSAHFNPKSVFKPAPANQGMMNQASADVLFALATHTYTSISDW